MSQRIPALTAIALTFVLGACAKEEAVVDVKGSCADANKAQMCTFAKMKGATLVETGFVLPIASIENAPLHAEMTWPPKADAAVDFPDAATKQGGVHQLTFYWESDGHPPGAFLNPHFDFHFTTVPAAEFSAMDCKDVSKPAALPAAYGLPDVPLPPDMAKMTGVPTLVGLCVPQMGMHAILSSEIERKDSFDGTMVIGYYKGKVVFIEPMIAKSMLMKMQSFDLPIPDMPGFTTPHPTKFHAEWDAPNKSYRFTMSGFTPAT
jgi:hypothetical protein